MLAEQEVRANLESLNRELERRVIDRTAELESVNQELTRANRAKDIFLATLSHELRTPLTPILGWSKLLRQSSTDPAFVMQGLDVIERNARLQTKLIDDLLDISRIVAGKLHLEMEPTDLRWVVKAAVETIRDKAEGARVQVATNMDNAPLVVNGSPAHLQQVVSNLLTNAIKFTPEGGQVNVEIRRERKSARIAVSDTGEGIAAEFLPQVFNLFAQGRHNDNSATWRPGPGARDSPQRNRTAWRHRARSLGRSRTRGQIHDCAPLRRYRKCRSEATDQASRTERPCSPC